MKAYSLSTLDLIAESEMEIGGFQKIGNRSKGEFSKNSQKNDEVRKRNKNRRKEKGEL